MTSLEQSIRRTLLDTGKSRHAFGLAGESIIMRALENNGWKVINAPERKCGDLWVMLPDDKKLYVEVKSSKRCKDGNYRWCLTRQFPNGRTCTNHQDSAFVILLAVTRALTPVVYVIPSVMLADQKNVCMSDNSLFSGGKYNLYRQNINSLNLAQSVTVALGE